MSYTPIEKTLLSAARLLKTNCKSYAESCEGCIFNTEDGCVIDRLPECWEILSEEEEEL